MAGAGGRPQCAGGRVGAHIVTARALWTRQRKRLLRGKLREKKKIDARFVFGVVVAGVVGAHINQHVSITP